MKKNKTKLVIVLAILLSFSFAIVPLTTKAADSNGTNSSKTLIRNKLKDKQVKGTSTSATKLALNASSTKATKGAKALADAISKADDQVSKRIDSVNNLITKIQNMKNIGDGDKSSLVSDLQGEITKLTSLKTKIDGDIDVATVKKDLISLTSSTRIYALVIPKANILASVDKINTIATMFGTIATKLQARVDELKASSTDVTALQAAIDGIRSKISDAKNEALTAQTTVSGLVPDNGDKTKMDENNANLKSARVNIKNANQDLSTARKYAGVVMNALRPAKNPNEKIDKNKVGTSTKSN